MATLAGGEDFSASPTGVTGTRLDNHVNNATISNVAQADMASSNGVIVRSASAPSDTDAGWWDTANNVFRIHNGTAWLPVATGALLTNKSGGQVVAGDVVVADTTTAESFKTSTTLGDTTVIGVVAETIASDASGVVLYGGIQDVLITGSATLGQFLKQSTTAKKATATSTKGAGSFGLVLEAGTDTTIKALITGASTTVLDATSAETISGDWIFSGAPTFTGTFWATQAAMEAASSNVLAATPGRINYHPGVAKAWGRFNGTGTPAFDASYNFDSSVTDNGTGDYTLSFATDFSSANYAFVGTAGGSGGPENARVIIDTASASPTSSAIRISVTNTANTRVDSSIICVVAFGDQA